MRDGRSTVIEQRLELGLVEPGSLLPVWRRVFPAPHDEENHKDECRESDARPLR
jgi:hypothetical protein